MDTRIPGIIEKLEQAREIYPQLKRQDPFGISYHEFEMYPSLSKSALVEFEAEHKIKLPQDYADFLCYVGNGGAGPYYGIYPLKKWDYGTRTEGGLSTLWPYPPELCQKPAWEKYREEQEKDPDWQAEYPGAITICDQGCTYYALLIVTGELAGRVCYIDTEGQVPCLMKELDFLSWYERWLDEVLAGVKHFWYGMD